MAISYDNAAWENMGTISSGSFSYTNNGNLLILYLYFLGTTGNSDKITGVTYNGVAMTQIKKVTFLQDGSGGANEYTLYAYALQNPATGSHSIAVTASATAALIVAFPESLIGADGGVEASASGTGTSDGSGNLSPLSITSTATGAWLSTGMQLAGITSISGYTQRAGSGHDSQVYDTAGTVSPGSHTPVYHLSSSGKFGGAIALSISPTAATAPPSVSTSAASSVTLTSSTLNGNITAEGSTTPDERGFVWDTESHSDPGNVAPASSGYAEYESESGSFGTGAYSYNLDSLSGGQTYYVRAYAANSDGYAYGTEVSFTCHIPSGFEWANLNGIAYNANDDQTIFAEQLNDILRRLEALE